MCNLVQRNGVSSGAPDCAVAVVRHLTFTNICSFVTLTSHRKDMEDAPEEKLV
jgi:hypothetical protein